MYNMKNEIEARDNKEKIDEEEIVEKLKEKNESRASSKRKSERENEENKESRIHVVFK